MTKAPLFYKGIAKLHVNTFTFYNPERTANMENLHPAATCNSQIIIVNSLQLRLNDEIAGKYR